MGGWLGWLGAAWEGPGCSARSYFGRLLGLLSKVGPGVATSGSGGSVCGYAIAYFLIGGDLEKRSGLRKSKKS